MIFNVGIPDIGEVFEVMPHNYFVEKSKASVI